MAARQLPRYFVTRSDPEFPNSGRSQLEPCHAIDSFFLGGRHLVENEWVVTIDATGILKPVEGDELSDLNEIVQQDLAFNEVIGSAASRTIDSNEFYTFYLEAMEQPPETPGINDPLYLYGTLYGPFPAKSEESYVGIEGQLTVNRIDFLAGVVQSGNHAFHYQADGTGNSSAQRCFHILLPGDREEEIARGKGLIFAYPLMPQEVVMGEPWNEQLLAGLIYDVLSALKEDIAKEKIRHPITDMTLPVANRYWFIQQLESRGYVIKGDMAIRQPGASAGLPALLSSALGKLINDKVELPPEASIDEFIQLAKRTLEKLPGYPPPRTRALQARVRQASVEARAESGRKTAPSPPRPIKTPIKSATEMTEYPINPQPSPVPQPRKVDWMGDFIATHGHSYGDTRLSNISEMASASANAKQQQKRAQPDWMSDFSDTPAPGPSPQEKAQEWKTLEPTHNEPKRSEPKKDETKKSDTKKKEGVKDSGKTSQSKPEWMSDFD